MWGMTVLNMYSNTYIFFNTRLQDLYYSNSRVNKVSNTVFQGIYSLAQVFITKKLEPFYDPWCSLSYISNGVFNEHYMNLNDNIHYLRCFNPHAVFCLNPLETADFERSYILSTIQSSMFNMWSEKEKTLTLNNPCLITFRVKHRYVCRNSFSPENKISLEKTRKHFLCVEYTHPEMKNPIYLDIDPGYLLENNEILSELFVARCLKYQSSPFVFDKNYVIKIMDCMMNMVEMRSHQYMILTKDNYTILSVV